MLIFAIDDDPQALRRLRRTLEKAAPEAEIAAFARGEAALDAVDRGTRPDIVFSDVRMPGMDGLTLAERLRERVPRLKIVLATAHPEYALEAMRLHIDGYIVKPVSPERVAGELRYNIPEPTAAPERIVVRCFGPFEAYWQGRPLAFGRKQTKELLAFLVDREGAACTAEEIAAALWEDETDMSAAKHRLRQLISDLRNTLSEIGMEAVLVRRSGQLAILRDRVDCDYYRLLDGDANAPKPFTGAYMSQYRWAELTDARLTPRRAGTR